MVFTVYLMKQDWDQDSKEAKLKVRVLGNNSCEAHSPPLWFVSRYPPNRHAVMGPGVSEEADSRVHNGRINGV